MNERKSYSIKELRPLEEADLVEIARALGIENNRPMVLNKDNLMVFNRDKLIQEILINQEKKKLKNLLNFTKLHMITAICAAILVSVFYISYFWPDNDEGMGFVGGVDHPLGAGSLALFDGKALATIPANDGNPHWIYWLNITNGNNVGVRIDRIWIDLIDFEEISDFSIISAFEEIGGPGAEAEEQVFHGRLGAVAGTYNFRYLGQGESWELWRNRDNIETSTYVRLAPGQSEHIILFIEFTNQVSGVYTFTVNVQYIVDGEMKTFQSEVYSYFSVATSGHRYRNFYFGADDFSFSVAETIFDVLVSSNIPNDIYEMFERLVNPFSNSGVIIDSSSQLYELHDDLLYTGFSYKTVYPCGNDFLTYIEDIERFILVEEDNWKSFTFEEERMIQTIRLLFACKGEGNFSLPENMRLAFSGGSYRVVDISYGDWWYQHGAIPYIHGESPYVLVHGFYHFDTAIPSYSIKIEPLNISNYGRTYMTPIITAW